MTQRTLPQNKALHLYFRQLADELNGAGFDIQKTMKKDFHIPWNERTIKELIWHKVQEVMTDKTSTADLSTKEINDIYQVVTRHLAQTTGVSVAFPEYFNQGVE